MTSSAPRGRVLEVTQAEALGDAATEEEKLDEQKRQEMSLLLQTHSEVAVALGKFETWVNHGSMVGDSVGLVLTGFFEANADINNRIGAVFDLYGNPFPRSLSYAPMFTIHTLLKMKKDEKANPSRNPNLTAALKHFPTDRRQFRQFRYALLGRRRGFHVHSWIYTTPGSRLRVRVRTSSWMALNSRHLRLQWYILIHHSMVINILLERISSIVQMLSIEL